MLSFQTHKTSSLASTNINSCSSLPTNIKRMKMKALIHNLIFSHICRLVSKLKALLMEVCHEARLLCLEESDSELMKRKKKMNKYRKKMLFGSFRLHYNWCSSSHVLPINDNYYSGNSMFDEARVEEDGDGSTQLASYLEWLDDKANNNNNNNDNDGENLMNEIDKLADMFIADCHEKFRLEKIESYRRYQEMLARSM